GLLARITQQSERVAMDSVLGTPVIRLGLITTLYFRNSHTVEMKRRVEACFLRFYEAFKTRLKWQLFKRMRRLSGSGFASTRRQIVESPPDEQFIWS
ncbi:type VI immunity family protein, partial [Pseudomonas viridiflava]|uniref:type VI immunity family protein n=1 Tax=Pseudomonas viridiflava TaxID=33069 RepID=UPI003C784FF6